MRAFSGSFSACHGHCERWAQKRIYALPAADWARQAASPAAQLFLGVVAHGLKMRLIAAVLLILVRVELPQDKVLSEIARRKNEETERRFRPPV